jgi:hypothetical protein
VTAVLRAESRYPCKRPLGLRRSRPTCCVSGSVCHSLKRITRRNEGMSTTEFCVRVLAPRRSKRAGRGGAAFAHHFALEDEGARTAVVHVLSRIRVVHLPRVFGRPGSGPPANERRARVALTSRRVVHVGEVGDVVCANAKRARGDHGRRPRGHAPCAYTKPSMTGLRARMSRPPPQPSPGSVLASLAVSPRVRQRQRWRVPAPEPTECRTSAVHRV